MRDCASLYFGGNPFWSRSLSFGASDNRLRGQTRPSQRSVSVLLSPDINPRQSASIILLFLLNLASLFLRQAKRPTTAAALGWRPSIGGWK